MQVSSTALWSEAWQSVATFHLHLPSHDLRAFTLQHVTTTEMSENLLQQIWSVHCKSASTLNDMYGTILQTLLHQDVTAQKHWYQLACWKSSLIRLQHHVKLRK